MNVVEEGDSKSGDGDMLSISSNRDHLTNSWIKDSTCSYHMTPNKDWFDTYRLVNSGYVLMRNDASCRVVGMGISELRCLMVSLERCVMLDMFQN